MTWMTHDEAKRIARAEAEITAEAKAQRQAQVDEFAKVVIGGISAGYDWMGAKHTQYYQPDLSYACTVAYDLAEAMMAEREKRLK